MLLGAVLWRWLNSQGGAFELFATPAGGNTDVGSAHYDTSAILLLEGPNCTANHADFNMYYGDRRGSKFL